MNRRICLAGSLILGSAFAANSFSQPGAPLEEAAIVAPLACEILSPTAYHSPKLKAGLVLVRAMIPGFTFYAAQIESIDPGSPLGQIGLSEGDLITRLDGLKIADGRYYVATGAGGYWVFPEAERHYAQTQVRYLRAGSSSVQNGMVDLGPAIWPPNGNPGGNILPP